jgi:pyruvate formate lyase activating enzyme
VAAGSPFGASRVDAGGQPAAAEFVRPALLQEPLGERVRCLTCERRCEIAPGKVGWCRTRRNQDGDLVTLIYGALSSLSANPIEKKPLYHFYPGTRALTSGSWSCNFGCPWCQNYHISKSEPRGGSYLSPGEFVSRAVDRGCRGTSISFNEPTLSLEWSLDVFHLASARGLYNTYVTNGYMTDRALRLLVGAGLDAMNVDIKGDAGAVHRYCRGIDVDKVWRNCRTARQMGLHLEITTLVIPGVNDSDAVLSSIARRIVADLGPEVPWHVSGYYPAYRFTAPPTPLGALERACRLGREVGLDFVYLGNVPGHRLQNTYCPECGALLIERSGLRVEAQHMTDGRCPECGREIPGVWGPAGAPSTTGLAW